MKARKKFYLAAMLMTLTFALKGTGAPPIINGTEVTKDNPIFYKTARIYVNAGAFWAPSCTASIVSKDLILTAAHCVIREVDQILIGFGYQPVTTDSQSNPNTRVDVEAKFLTVKAESKAIFESDDQENPIEIALVKLAGEIPPEFQTVEFLPDSYLDVANKKTSLDGETHSMTLAGWGFYAESPVVRSALLRETTIPVQFSGPGLITDQTKGSGGCSGDSGGPAYVTLAEKTFLVGVTHGPYSGDVDCHHRGWYMNPNLFKDFLREAAARLGGHLEL